MALRYRTITGQFKNFLTDTPYKYGAVNIRLVQNSYTIDAGFPAYNKDIGLDATGALPVGLELFCNGDFLIPSAYEVKEPDGRIWSFTLNYDDGTPISIQALRAGGAVPENPETVNTLIAAEIAAKTVRFDIPQTLTGEEQQRVKTTLNIVGGGSGGSFLHTQNAASTEWIINHNLGYRPNLEVRNSGSQVVEAEIAHLSTNQARVYFVSAQTGEARAV